MIYWPNKRSAASLDYAHDFSGEIGDPADPIDPPTISVTVVQGDVVLSNPALVPDTQIIQVRISGGTHQTANRIRLYAETVAGRKLEQIANLRVRNL